MRIAQRRHVAQARPRLVPRRRRWLPPTITPAALPSETAGYLAEPFNGATLKSGWVEPAGATAVTVASGGAKMAATGGAWCQVTSPPFRLANRSITFEWEPHQTTTYMDLTVETADGGLTWVAQIVVDAGSVEWWIEPAVSNTPIPGFVAADWRWIRVESDIASPGDLTMRRSADGETWTLVGTGSIDPAELASCQLRVYAES